MHFELYKDASGQYRWRLRAKGNNEILAVPGEGFSRKDKAMANIDLFKAYAPTAEVNDLTVAGSDGRKSGKPAAEFEVYEDSSGEYRWRLQAPNNKIIGVASEGYSRDDSCIDAINLIKRDVSDAQVDDETGTGSKPKKDKKDRGSRGGGRFA